MNFFRCRSAATSVQGRRASNQDSVVDLKLPDGRHLVAVADGMGGHQSGEVASALALEVLASELGGGSGLREAVIAANQAVFEEAQRDPACAGMGTTLVALLRTEAVYEIANVGDSRAYRIEASGITQVSRDHSFAEEATRQALMGAEEIARSPWRNALTRSIGTQDSVEVDLFGPFEIAGRPHSVLLCSDGLYRSLSEEVAWRHLVGATDPASSARVLVDQALRQGSDDNISVAVIQFAGPAAPTEATPSQAPPSRKSPLRSLGEKAAAWASSRPRRRGSGHRSLLRRTLDVVLSDNVLFGLCTGILVMWLALRLLQG